MSPSTSSDAPSIHACPVPTSSIPTNTASASAATVPVISYCCHPVRPWIGRAPMLSKKPRAPFGRSTRIQMPARLAPGASSVRTHAR